MEALMSEITKEEAAKKLGYTNNNNPEKLNIPDLLQQTIDQTVIVTTHNIVDYMRDYIKQRDDYETNKEVLDEIITVLEKVEKRYEVKADGKNNSKIDSDNN